MENDNIVLNGRERLASGISKVTAVIRGTYGAAGGNVVLQEHLYPFHSVRNDGKAIVDKIKLADPIENMGADIMREVGDKADKDSGDGRKTTMILTEAILREASKIQALPMEIKRSLDECLPEITQLIDSQKKEIGIEDIGTVATISSESAELGSLIQEIYSHIGREGVIEIEPAKLPQTFYEITEGVRLRNTGYGIYSYPLMTSEEVGKVVVKNPKVLISKEKIVSTDQIEPIFKSLAMQGINELVLFCDDIDLSVANKLAMTHLNGKFKTYLIKFPTLWKDWVIEDAAKITGSTVVDKLTGKDFKNLAHEDLGTCDKIIITKDETRVIGIKDISDHIRKLEEQSIEDDQLKLRLNWLQTKVALLKVGANSESELSYIIKKAKDACASAHLALKDGVVKGGGKALIYASRRFEKGTIGTDILLAALRDPYEQICANHGHEPDMDGVIDPTIVVKNAVKNAISVAGIVLTSKGVISLPEEAIKPSTPAL
jgi:chaperonin GroEL